MYLRLRMSDVLDFPDSGSYGTSKCNGGYNDGERIHCFCLAINQLYSDFDPENKKHEITDIVAIVSVYKYGPATIWCLDCLSALLIHMREQSHTTGRLDFPFCCAA